MRAEEEEEDETIESPFVGVHKVEDEERRHVKNETPQWGKGGASAGVFSNEGATLHS